MYVNIPHMEHLGIKKTQKIPGGFGVFGPGEETAG